MTNEEAIEQLEWVKKRICDITYSPESFEALNKAIEALRNERDFEKEYMKHYIQGRKDERAILNGELFQSCSELELKNERPKDNDLCETCINGDVCELSTKIFTGCRTTRCYKHEEVDNEHSKKAERE